LGFDFDLVGLDLLQVQLAVSYQLSMQFFTLLPGSLPPLAYRALIDLHGSHNGWHRTAIG
jgi:hypothetical protein